MIYYKCRRPDGAVLWQEITDDGGMVVRLIDGEGREIPPGTPLAYAIESTDPSLWPSELLPAYRARRQEALGAAYEAAVVRDYPSGALGEVYTYPSGLIDKLYMNARVSQALVVQSAIPVWQPNAAVVTRQQVRPRVWNGWIYICSAAGTTGATEPVWPLEQGAQVRDGTAAWMAWQYWTGRFICKDGGEYVRRDHSPEQILQVGMEGASFVQAQLDRRDALAAEIAAAADIVSIDTLDLSFP
jgi:hypothetical protein